MALECDSPNTSRPPFIAPERDPGEEFFDYQTRWQKVFYQSADFDEWYRSSWESMKNAKPFVLRSAKEPYGA